MGRPAACSCRIRAGLCLIHPGLCTSLVPPGFRLLGERVGRCQWVREAAGPGASSPLSLWVSVLVHASFSFLKSCSLK